MMQRLLIVLLLCLKLHAVEICALTIPKSGTHLLLKLIHLLNQEGNLPFEKAYKCHFYYYDGLTHNQVEPPHCKKIALIRDLRDVIVSFIHFLDGDAQRIPGFIHLDERDNYIKMETFQEKLTYILSPGNKIHESFIMNCIECIESLNDPSILFLRFEDLVGSRGGGSDEAQALSIRKILDFLSMSLADETLAKIQSQLFGGTYTFRSGQIGSWEDLFSPEQAALFEQSFGPLNRQILSAIPSRAHSHFLGKKNSPQRQERGERLHREINFLFCESKKEDFII